MKTAGFAAFGFVTGGLITALPAPTLKDKILMVALFGNLCAFTWGMGTYQQYNIPYSKVQADLGINENRLERLTAKTRAIADKVLQSEQSEGFLQEEKEQLQIAESFFKNRISVVNRTLELEIRRP